MRNNRPFQPQHGSTLDARIRHIERHLSEVLSGQTARAMASAPAPPPPVISDTIPEEYVEFDNVDGHEHTLVGAAVTIAGDVTGTNQTATVVKIEGTPIPAPVAGDDQKVIQYNHGTVAFRYTTLPTSTITVQEGDSTVDAAVTTLDFGSGFDVTSSPSGEANIALDLSEVISGDATAVANALIVTGLQQKSVPSPGGGDNGKILAYVSGSTQFLFKQNGTSIDGWYYDNAAASLSGQAMSRLAGGGSPQQWVAPGGRIVGIWVYSNAARTAGTLTVNMRANGAGPSLASAVLNGTDTTYATGTCSVDPTAGTLIGIEITTDGSWAPTTADIQAGILWVPWTP